MTNADTSIRQRDLEIALKRAELFARVDAQTIKELAASATRRVRDSGVVLFQRGDAGDYLLALVPGRVRLSVSTPGGSGL